MASLVRLVQPLLDRVATIGADPRDTPELRVRKALLLVLSVLWLAMLSLPPHFAALVTAGAYAGVRWVNQGRAEGFIQHWIDWKLRRSLTDGRLSAAARARSPRFPFAESVSRDVSRREP